MWNWLRNKQSTQKILCWVDTYKESIITFFLTNIGRGVASIVNSFCKMPYFKATTWTDGLLKTNKQNITSSHPVH